MPFQSRKPRAERSLSATSSRLGVVVVASLVAGPFILGIAGCPEQPVMENVELRFLPEGDATVTTTVSLALDEAYKDNAAAQQRVQEFRQAMLDGRDPWLPRFEALEADAEQIQWDMEQGQLVRALHRAYVSDPTSIGKFLSDTPIAMNYASGDGWAEFSIYPGGPWRATGEQRQQLSKMFDQWTKDVTRYLTATKALYEYLDKEPGRARACMGAVFEDLLSEDAVDRLEDVTMQEDELTVEVGDSLSAVLGLFLVPKNEAFSANELSHLVYDPFPAPVSVRVPGRILEAQGFASGAEGGLTIPGLGLWGALRALEGHWVSPDPLVAYYMHARKPTSKREFDLEGFLSRRRTYVTPPTPPEVRQAVEQLLQPASVYRVRWVSRPRAKRDEKFDWEQLQPGK
jgi:hypothetical protein